MKIFSSVLLGALLLSSTSVLAVDTRDQESYDQQFEANMKQITFGMREMSMNLGHNIDQMAQYLDESEPRVSENMREFISSARSMVDRIRGMSMEIEGIVSNIDMQIGVIQQEKARATESIPAEIRTEQPTQPVVVQQSNISD